MINRAGGGNPYVILVAGLRVVVIFDRIENIGIPPACVVAGFRVAVDDFVAEGDHQHLLLAARRVAEINGVGFFIARAAVGVGEIAVNGPLVAVGPDLQPVGREAEGIALRQTFLHNVFGVFVSAVVRQRKR